MKILLLISIILFGFNSCSTNTPEATVVYADRNITKLQKWGKIPKVPEKARLGAPISIREVVMMPKPKQALYVAVIKTQLQHASKTSLIVRNRLYQALDGIAFYEYQVDTFNKAYGNKNITR